MADDYGVCNGQLAQQRGHVADQIENCVMLDVGGRVGATVAAHVGSNTSIARRSERDHLMSP